MAMYEHIDYNVRKSAGGMAMHNSQEQLPGKIDYRFLISVT